MKKILLLVIAVMMIAPAVILAGDKKKKAAAKKETTTAATDDSTGIHWLTLDEAQVAMKKEPKKVYMDVYTDWCGWCKVMEKKTFTNANVIRYINKHFYAVRFNAETKETIRFGGKMYDFMPQYKANQLAVDLMQGQMSYPTSIIFEENFQGPQPVPGYLDVANMEMILKYLGENIFKTMPFPDYQKQFKASWM